MLRNSQTKHTTPHHLQHQLLERLSHAIIRSKDSAFVVLVIAQMFGRYINWLVQNSLIFIMPNSSQGWKNKDSSWSPLHADRTGKRNPRAIQYIQRLLSVKHVAPSLSKRSKDTRNVKLTDAPIDFNGQPHTQKRNRSLKDSFGVGQGPHHPVSCRIKTTMW